MLRRLASLALLFMTLGVFVFHKAVKDTRMPEFVDTYRPMVTTEQAIAQDEYLILMDHGFNNHLDDVLLEFDLKVISSLGDWVHVAQKEAINTQHIALLNSTKAKENLKLLAQIEAHPFVHSGQLNYVDEKSESLSCVPAQREESLVQEHGLIPAEPYFRFQWYLSKQLGIDLPGAWAITTGNPKIVIAVVDRNFNFYQRNSRNDFCESRNFYYKNILDFLPNAIPPILHDDHHHGSYVMSVIATCADIKQDLAAIDWQAQVFAVDTKSDASLSTRLLALLWAAGIDVCKDGVARCNQAKSLYENKHPAKVINASFGFGGPFLFDPPYGPVLDAIGRINQKGCIIVASAGNEGSLADRRLPGSASGVIAVGSSNRLKESSDFSNFGRTIDVVSPGEDILGLSNGQLVSLNGTSFSAALVSPVVTLIVGEEPDFSWKHAEHFLKKAASPMSCNEYCPNSFGHAIQKSCKGYCCIGDRVICAKGIVNAQKSVELAIKGPPKLPLIDLDDYYLALADNNNLKTELVVKNWGKKPGIVRMKRTDRHLKISPETFEIPAMNDSYSPGLKKITVSYDVLPAHGVITSLTLETSAKDSPKVFHDRIEAIVEIVPDKNPQRTERVLMELPPND